MIGDNYLHVQRWRPNFIVESEVIKTLPVWVHFPILPLEYYKEDWIAKAGNTLARTLGWMTLLGPQQRGSSRGYVLNWISPNLLKQVIG